MPLQKGSSETVIGSNIAELVRAGHPQKQAEAIAYRVAHDITGAEDDFDGLVKKLMAKGYSKEYATKVAGKVAVEKGDKAEDRMPFVFATDKDSVRRLDEFGRMHVAEANISKAVINPYYGREIPNWEELGLQPDRIYYLYRDPVELAKSVPTWNKIPLLIKHIGHSADSPVKEWVAGTTGESSLFDPPYLKNSLCLWDGGAIAGVETGKQRELSCSYAYVADMTPGSVDGQRYDGVMRNIVGNHVAIVTRGRAGTDVAVGDSALPEPIKEQAARSASGKDATAADGLGFHKESFPMNKTGIIAVRTALGAYLRPLANDAIPLRDLVKPGMSVEEVAEGVKTHYKGTAVTIDAAELAKTLKLAHDEAEDMDDDEDDDDGADDEDETEEERKEREEREARDKKAAKDKRAKDRKAARDKAARDKKAKDEPPAGPGGPRDRSGGAAEDADSIRASLRQEFRELRQAEDDVRPLVGTLVAMDSATDVYAAALKQLGVNIEGVHPSAYPALIEMQKKVRSNVRSIARPLAGDTNTVQSVTELFPGARKPLRA